MTLEEWLAVQRGEDLEGYRKEEALRKRIRKKAEQYRNSPVDSWPKIEINWDVTPESQRFSFDGQTKQQFEEYHPEGLCLGYVELDQFDKILCHFSRRDEGELWEVGFQDKLAFLIVYVSEGHPISPPVAKPTDGGKVILIGGHHRYAIAKAIDERKIPIYVCPEHKSEIGTRVAVEWK